MGGVFDGKEKKVKAFLYPFGLHTKYYKENQNHSLTPP
jgi:hypothetical protein